MGRVFERMNEFGVHTNMWTMSCDAAGAANAIAATNRWDMDFVEILLLDPAYTDAALGRKLLEQVRLPMFYSLGLLEQLWPLKKS